MADPRVNGFTRLTYLDGEVLILPRAAYEGLTTALTSVSWKAEEVTGGGN